MKLMKLAFRKETAMPMLALVFASGAAAALVAARMVWTGSMRDGFLLWNLFLAWLPLVFALLACDAYRKGAGRNWRFLSLAGAWLLFFPNAPYIFTDFTHLSSRFHGQYWADLVLILICALTGLVLGFVSLFLMQSVVARMLGRAASWLFIACVAGLSGVGIYLGRFLRFNSWDVVVKPLELGRDLGHLAANPLAHAHSVKFSALFATFTVIAYLMLYALTHLRHAQPGAPASPPAC